MDKNKITKESRDEVLERILEETARNPYKPANKKKSFSAGDSQKTEKRPVRKEYVQRTQVFSSTEAQEALQAEIEAQKKKRRTAVQKKTVNQSTAKPGLRRPESGETRPIQNPAKAKRTVRDHVKDDIIKEQPASKQHTTSAADKISKIKKEKAAAAKAAILKKAELESAIKAQEVRSNKPFDNSPEFSENYEDTVDAAISEGENEKYNIGQKNLEKSGMSLLFEAIDLFQYVLCLLLIVFVLFNYMFIFSGVSGESMYPTLSEGDELLIRNINYTPEKGDVVAIDNKTAVLLDENKNIFEKNGLECKIVKRIIALGGDTVDIDFKKGEVKVNGQALEEKYISEPTTRDEGAFEYPLTIPEGYVFVLGDNRNVSKDSRHIDVGLIPEDEILGKVVLKLYPFGSFGSIE